MATRNLVRAVQAALGASPVTLRTLSKRAGVSHSLAAYLLRGTRAPTPAVAERLALALESIAQDATEGAAKIRRSLPKEPQ